MANISVPVSDDKVLDYLAKKFGFVQGDLRLSDSGAVEVIPQPRVANSSTSHIVRIHLEASLELGDVEKLVAF
ncbi:hypothetical protein [Microbacterium schleiferi]|jgi:hypothetical protein|uniref:hypothetical protein n=1 Tax=Microbacterium schleiferi TaxID=69362 RepID=UPI000DFDAB19|nr:MAG: hypothetical protein DBW62_04045 [Microbacterium sp.]